LNEPAQTLRAGWGYLSPEATDYSRTPAGHPEGYLEAFANIYAAFFRAVRAHASGQDVGAARCDFPDVDAGVRGMAFIDAALRSAQSDQKWTPFL
jgi:hypothetical protein